MRKASLRCAALAAALVLLLCACGSPAGPGAPAAAADLSAFAAGFDLTDLSRFLSEPQLAALDAAVRETLAEAGFAPESFSLFYDAPPEGSVKLPFDNAGGLDLARLDTGRLAAYIVGQIAPALDARGAATVPTESANPTSANPSTGGTNPPTIPPTQKPTVSSQPSTSTTRTTATQNPETTQQKEMYPEEMLLANSEIKFDINPSNGHFSNFNEYPNSGFNVPFTANGKTYVFCRDKSYHDPNYYKNDFKAGAQEKVAIYEITGKRDGKNVLRRYNTYDCTVVKEGNDPVGYRFNIVPDRNDNEQIPGYANPVYKSIEFTVGMNVGMPFFYRVTNMYVNSSSPGRPTIVYFN